MAEQITGKLEIRNTDGNVVFVLDPESQGRVGPMLKLPSDVHVLIGEDDAERMEVFGSTGHATIGGDGEDGILTVADRSDDRAIRLDSGDASIEAGGFGSGSGEITLRNSDTGDVVKLKASGAGEMHLEDDVDDKAELSVGDLFSVFEQGSADGPNLGRVWIGSGDQDAELRVVDGDGNQVLWFGSEHALLHVGGEGNEGDIRVLDGDGEVRVHLDGASGDVKLHGADCAEWFDTATADPAAPGTVMVIDEDGRLRPCSRAHDRRVAGVCAGAGDLRPGVLLGDRPAAGDQDRTPVSIAGRAYCMTDARTRAVSPGDLLTTSDTPGHAMRADDPIRAFGSVVGKALAALEDGRGLVPIVVALQ